MPALGTAVTVTVVDAVSFAQTPVPTTTYLISDVPADTGVTSPLPSIVATPVDTELHVPPVPVVDNVVVPFAHNEVDPVISPASGAEVMVKLSVTIESQPTTFNVSKYLSPEVEYVVPCHA